MFDKVSKYLAAWRTELDKLEHQLETKLQRLTYLMEAPLPAEDVADIVIGGMLANAETEFHRHLEIKIARLLKHPMNDYSNAWWQMLCNHSAPGGVAQAPELFWALREPISAAIREAIIGWKDYPDPGPPRAQRQKEITKLKTDIETLRSKIEAEREAANQVGVSAAGLHNRPSVRKPNRSAE